MKAGNRNLVVMTDVDGVPWGVALGDDVVPEHEGGCHGLRDWLGIQDDAPTVADGLCHPITPGPDQALMQPATRDLATLIVLNRPSAAGWPPGKDVRPRDVLDGAFCDECRVDDALVTAHDRGIAVPAAFKPADRKLLGDTADSMAAGRLAIADASAVRVGPMRVLVDKAGERLPPGGGMDGLGGPSTR
ncbi:hypothetical protein [Methylobacterium aquaticum]|nr:hypothetical protein [Methylobacterium aquaticum]